MKAEDFRALKFKEGTTLIIKKENFELLLNATKSGEHEVEEVQVTKEMLDNAQVLLPPTSIKIPEVPNLDYIKNIK